MPDTEHTLRQIPKNARGLATYDGCMALRAPKAKDDGLVWFVGTTEHLDEHHSIILAQGLNWDRYLENPIILLNHQNEVGSIAGRAQAVKQITKPHRGFEIGVEFNSEGSPEVTRAERLARAGILRGMSMGFIERKVRWASELSEAERVLWGIPRNGFLVEEADVAEFSLVALPSNPTTLQRAIAAGALTEEDARGLAMEPPEDEPQEDAGDEPMKGCEALLRALVEGQRELAEVVERAVAGMLEDNAVRMEAFATALVRIEELMRRGGDPAEAERVMRAKVATLAGRIRVAVGANGRAPTST